MALAPYTMPSSPHDVIRQTIAECAARHGLRYEELIGRSLLRCVVKARYEAIRLIHAEYPLKSYPELGRIFHRDHSTVMYALGALKNKRPLGMRSTEGEPQ